MSSDYSRLIFDRKKHYSAVRMQQGRVLLDSDWNSQLDILQNRIHKQSIDVIGKTGVPVDTNGFLLSTSSDMQLSLSAGRIYINGLLCELEDNIDFEINSKPFLVSHDTGLPYGLVDSELTDGIYVVYLEAWQREITYLDDHMIREKALGDPDTTTRLQVVWKLSFEEVDEGSLCSDVQLPTNDTTGMLEARTTTSDTNTNPCDFSETSGYRRLENQLYRVEIQSGGSLSEATFKWSRENASVMTSVSKIKGTNTLVVNSLGRDDVLGFSIGDWVELINHESSLSREVHNLFQIEDINRSTLEIAVNGTVDHFDTNGLKMIRWDQSQASIPLSSDFVHLEDGIEVRFKEGDYRAGDYWLIPARTIDSSIEWDAETSKLPHGVQTAVAKIGIVEIANESIEKIIDCRPLFPSLTDLIDATKGCCTFHVRPVQGWENVFDMIGEGQDAKVCFEVGEYNLSNSKKIADKGHIVITGSGHGTIIQANTRQEALRFENCESVNISNLTFRTNSVKNQDRSDVMSLKGSLTVINTPFVSADKLTITCGNHPKPQASCISYYNDSQIPGSIHISNCNLNVGYNQHGIIIINAKRSIVENNVITVRPKPNNFTVIDRVRGDNRTRNAFMRILMRNFSEVRTSETNETISFGNLNLSFRTNPDLRNANIWQRLIRENPPSNDISTFNQLKRHLENTVLTILKSGDINHTRIRNFVSSINEQDPSLGYQGIVIGGRIATDVHIIRNRIENFLQGIHIGLSHSHGSNEEYDIINSAKVEKNFIKNILPLLHTHARHGIFIGNCQRLFIDNNELELHRMSKANKVSIDAIKVWGILGRTGTIANNQIFSTDNSIHSYNTGIRIEDLEEKDNELLWNVSWNSILANNPLALPSNIFSDYLDTNFI